MQAKSRLMSRRSNNVGFIRGSRGCRDALLASCRINLSGQTTNCRRNAQRRKDGRFSQKTQYLVIVNQCIYNSLNTMRTMYMLDCIYIFLQSEGLFIESSTLTRSNLVH